ncbi:MAG: FtsX-like permease family protein [Nannocystaceae bacterium]
MKPKTHVAGDPPWNLSRLQAGRSEVGGRGYLLFLWVICPAALLLGLPEPPWTVVIAGWAGVAAFSVLFLRVTLLGFSGYERAIGLRIIQRERSVGRRRRPLLIALGVTIAALAVLVVLQSERFSTDAAFRGLSGTGLLKLALVTAVACGTFFVLLLLLTERFSVFGTTSILGVVLGVAALVVVQSVATGFQHEFERRVLGVYAHINVTRSYGIIEYRRFENWLRELPGVVGASPFSYYSMVLAPYGTRGEEGGGAEGGADSSRATRRGGEDIKFASVLVKGIEPETADQVIDVLPHLERGSGRVVALGELRSEHVLMPLPDRPDDQLPAVIAATPDPRGEGWYKPALARAKEARARGGTGVGATAAGGTRSKRSRRSHTADAWVDPPSLGDKPLEGDVFDEAHMPTMFVGKTLAAELHLAQGDQVLLVEPGGSFDHSEEPKLARYRIAGIFQAGFQEYDERLVYVDIKELQRFKYRDRDQVSGVDLRLSDPSLAAEVGAVIRSELGDEYSVLEWQKLNENLFSAIRTQKNVITIILSLVIFVASFNVLSALWTMVVRRTPEIAIIMSMGGTGPQVARIFQVTGMTIGLAGSLAGVALGLVMCWLVQLFGYTLDPEVYFIEELPVEISASQILSVLGMTLVICFIATIPPSLRAGRLRPVEGLRCE